MCALGSRRNAFEHLGRERFTGASEVILPVVRVATKQASAWRQWSSWRWCFVSNNLETIKTLIRRFEPGQLQLMARRGRGAAAKSAGRAGSQPRDDTPVIGTLRPLVPFYVPDGAEGAGKVNTELRSYERGKASHDSWSRNERPAVSAEASSGGAAPDNRIPVRVRRWDALQGTFGPEDVHYVQVATSSLDGEQQSKAPVTLPYSSAQTLVTGQQDTARNLLTPDSILQQRTEPKPHYANPACTISKELATSLVQYPNHGARERPESYTPGQAANALGAPTSHHPMQNASRRHSTSASERIRYETAAPLKHHTHRNGSTSTTSHVRLDQGKRCSTVNDGMRYAGASYSATVPTPQAVPIPKFARRYLEMQTATPGPSTGASSSASTTASGHTTMLPTNIPMDLNGTYSHSRSALTAAERCTLMDGMQDERCLLARSDYGEQAGSPAVLCPTASTAWAPPMHSGTGHQSVDGPMPPWSVSGYQLYQNLGCEQAPSTHALRPWPASEHPLGPASLAPITTVPVSSQTASSVGTTSTGHDAEDPITAQLRQVLRLASPAAVPQQQQQSKMQRSPRSR